MAKKLVPFEKFVGAERKRPGQGGVRLTKGIQGHHGNDGLDQFFDATQRVASHFGAD